MAAGRSGINTQIAKPNIANTANAVSPIVSETTLNVFATLKIAALFEPSDSAAKA